MKQVVSPPDLPVNTGSGWENVTLVGWQEQPMATHGPWFSKMEIDQEIQKHMAWSTFNSISLQTIRHGSDSRFNRWHIDDWRKFCASFCKDHPLNSSPITLDANKFQNLRMCHLYSFIIRNSYLSWLLSHIRCQWFRGQNPTVQLLFPVFHLIVSGPKGLVRLGTSVVLSMGFPWTWLWEKGTMTFESASLTLYWDASLEL